MKHKNYKWIMAWAEGDSVQYKNWTLDGAYDSWKPVVNPKVFDLHEMCFRIKPKVKKTGGYKRYIIGFATGYQVSICFKDKKYPLDPETVEGFVRWIDKDWKYEDVLV